MTIRHIYVHDHRRKAVKAQDSRWLHMGAEAKQKGKAVHEARRMIEEELNKELGDKTSTAAYHAEKEFWRGYESVGKVKDAEPATTEEIKALLAKLEASVGVARSSGNRQLMSELSTRIQQLRGILELRAKSKDAKLSPEDIAEIKTEKRRKGWSEAQIREYIKEQEAKTADSLTVTYAQLQEKFKQGKWEAQADLRKSGVTWGTQEIRVVGTGKVMQVRVEEIPGTTDAGVLKHIETMGNAVVKVYWLSHTREYTCRLFVDDRENVNAEYFTDELEDAKNTAKDMARRANTKDKKTRDGYIDVDSWEGWKMEVKDRWPQARIEGGQTKAKAVLPNGQICAEWGGATNQRNDRGWIKTG